MDAGALASDFTLRRRGRCPYRAGQTGDAAGLNLAGRWLSRLEIAVLAMGKPASTDVYAQPGKLARDSSFSRMFIDAPGLVSPSRNVVSNIICHHS